MFCDPLDIPNELIAAQEAGELVIFAGAGVSCGAPANLPLFGKLTEEIGIACGKTIPAKREDFDVILGGWAGEGVPVHRLCKVRVGNSASQATAVHKALLRLFRKPEDIRIVTTNYDRHFAAAATSLPSGERVREYHAPALPLGTDFRGIVHLHGSVEEEEKTLVLTDRDFGRAYLSEGWARTFLQGLYANYVVLFVGYSHADVLVTYLARGLTAKTNRGRFVITPADEHGKWDALGVQRITYPKTAGPDSHIALSIGLERWAELASMTPLAVEDRIRRIVTFKLDTAALPEGADLAGESRVPRASGDFLKKWLQRDEGCRWFFQHIKPRYVLRWLRWLNAEGLMKTIANLEPIVDNNQRSIVENATRYLVNLESVDAFRIFEDNGERLGYDAWHSAALAIVHSAANRDNQSFRKQWMLMLLESLDSSYRTRLLPDLIKKAAEEGLRGIALAFFAKLLEPRCRLGVQAFVGGNTITEQVRWGVETCGDAHDLREAWASTIAPFLYSDCDAITVILEAAAGSVYLRNGDEGNPPEYGDPLSAFRSEIEEPTSLYDPNGVELISDFLIAVVRFRCEQGDGVGLRQIEKWILSERIGLVRIGLFALRTDPTLSVQQKAELMTKRGLIFPDQREAAGEARRVICTIFSSLEAETALRLLAAIEVGPPETWLLGATSEEDRNRMRADEVSRFLQQIAQDNPTNQLIEKTILRLHIPKTDSASPLCDNDFRAGNVKQIVQRSLSTVEELLDMVPEKVVELVKDYVGESWPKPSRIGLLNTVAEASGKKPAWGVQVLRCFASRNVWTGDVWTAVLWQLRFEKISSQDRIWLLRGASENRVDDDTLNGLTFLFFGLHQASIQGPRDPIEMEELLRFSLVVWERERGAPCEVHKGFAETDYVTIAINSPAGRVVEFWLRHIGQMRKDNPQLPYEWPAELAMPFASMVSGTTEADRLGLAIVATDLGFARYVAPKWTQQKFYPVMRFDISGEMAHLPWRAWLNYGRFSRELVNELPPLFLEAVEHLLKPDDKITVRFFSNIAIVCLADTVNPIDGDWLWQLIERFSSSQRSLWTKEIASVARNVDTERLSRCWNVWARCYVQGRLNGRCGVFSDEEKVALALWPVAFPSAFADAFNLIKQVGTLPNASHFEFLHALEKSQIIEQDGLNAAQYLAWLLEGSETTHDSFFLSKIVKRIAVSPASAPALEKLCNQLFRIGVQGAPDVLQTIRKMHQTHKL